MPPFPRPSLSRLVKPKNYIQLLARATGDVPSAVNEYCWLKDHVNQLLPLTTPEHIRKDKLWKLCLRRSKHEPLQYILGSQPFGELEIKCVPGVLIPRPETEAYTIHLAKLLDSLNPSEYFTEHDDLHMLNQKNTATTAKRTLRILDICAGSGCISLLLHALLSKKFFELSIRGWDIDPLAKQLASENLALNVEKGTLNTKALTQIGFHQINIFEPTPADIEELDRVDVIISNPPYISTEKFLTETTESVRKFEPRRALVPPPGVTLYRDPNHKASTWPVLNEDIFYAQLLYYHARRWRCRVMVMEIGDDEQAIRVAHIARSRVSIAERYRIEIWRDFPDQEAEGTEIETEGFRVIGAGKMRSVVLILDQEPGLKRPDNWYVQR